MGQGIKNVFTFRRIKMENKKLAEEIGATSYPGRGIVIGLTPDGKKAAIAYFIMGRSSNSRNRVLTDTIYDLMAEGKTFEQSLRTREFEPDGPNYTPRISGILHMDSFKTSTSGETKFNYEMSILKSNKGNPAACSRYTFSYDVPLAGEVHFIHTYMGDGEPLPSFEGEPTPLSLETNNLDEFTELVWNALNDDNKVSLFTRFIDVETGETETRIVNKNVNA